MLQEDGELRPPAYRNESKLGITVRQILTWGRYHRSVGLIKTYL